MIDLKILEYATTKQAEYIKAVNKYGSQRKAAASLGCSKGSVCDAVSRAKLAAAKHGYSPEHNMENTVPDGYSVKGVSTLYDGEGNVKAQWVKSQADQQKQEEMLRIVADVLADNVRGLSKTTKAPKNLNADLLAGYPLPEPHFGMFSWGKETGEDYDCSIASNILLTGMKQLVDSAPPAETALISSLGDWFHTDSTNNTTAKAGNQLDVDTRWERVVKLGVAVMRDIINLALAKHKHVIIKGVKGNHDAHTAFMLSLIMGAYFENNKRVTVDMSPSPFKFHRFGLNLIGINHGDMAKPAELPMIMAEANRKDWGETLYNVWWTGHVHHLTRKEFTGCTVESFRSVAAKDSWHHASGYRSLRDAQCVIFHKDRGEVQRITVAI